MSVALPSEFEPSREVEAVRRQLDHPVIDGDGHLIEYLPAVRDLLGDLAGPTVVASFDRMVAGGALVAGLSPEARRAVGLHQMSWWGLPTANTLDRATAMLPALMYRRLDQLGIDFALLYPTYGLTVTGLPDAELRTALARACNTYVAEAYGPFRDRLEPVASIPMHTPEEAVAELDFAIGTLGLKAVMMGGVVVRSRPTEAGAPARWVDTLGPDSEFDYEPVWQRCEELGVAPTFHGTGMGWGSRTSSTNYVTNHIGNFATAGEAMARHLLFDGVPTRHPDLRFCFCEGGVAWGANLFSDVLGHWAKRNGDAVRHYDPARLDRPLLASLFDAYGNGPIGARLDRLPDALRMLSDPETPWLDDFAASGLSSPEEIRRVFTEQYFFGCEADDPMNAMAFDTGRNPMGARLPAVFASDIGHWDVPDFTEVLPEAWELVEHGHLTADDFRRFTCDNARALWEGVNPRFFDGTVVARPTPSP